MAQRLNSLQWITMSHLEINLPTEFTTFILVSLTFSSKETTDGLLSAQKELRKMNEYRTPREKVSSIYLCCQAIYRTLGLCFTRCYLKE